MSGNSKRRRDAKREAKTVNAPRGFHDVPRSDVLAALGELYANLVHRPGAVYYAEVVHDAGCPAMTSNSLSDCTCSTVSVHAGGQLQ